MDKIIITAAVTGNVPTKEMTGFVPVSPEEIIEDVIECRKAGASVAHIHARDMDGRPTCDRKVFEKILKGIRDRGCDIILQVSTGARGGENTLEGRSAMLDVKNAEMASLCIGSSNFAHSVNANSPDLISGLAEKIYRYSLVPELECFDVAMAENITYLLDKGVLKGKPICNMVMNVPGSIRGTKENLDFMLSKVPNGLLWNLSAIGKSHTTLVPYAISKGGNIRTGIEDLITLNGELVSNAELVTWVRKLAEKEGREAATPDEARKMLGIG